MVKNDGLATLNWTDKIGTCKLRRNEILDCNGLVREPNVTRQKGYKFEDTSTQTTVLNRLPWDSIIEVNSSYSEIMNAPQGTNMKTVVSSNKPVKVIYTSKI